MQLTYPAELAGLHYGVRSTVAGLLISVYGYSDTLAALAQVGGAQDPGPQACRQCWHRWVVAQGPSLHCRLPGRWHSWTSAQSLRCLSFPHCCVQPVSISLLQLVPDKALAFERRLPCLALDFWPFPSASITIIPTSLGFVSLLQTVLDRALAFQVLPDRFQVVKEKKQKDFANMK